MALIGGADYDLPTMPRSTAVMKKEETAQVVKNLGVAMNLLLDVTSGGGDPQAPARGKRKKKAAPGPAVKRGDDELIPEDQDVMRADPSPKEVDMQRLKTDRSVETRETLCPKLLSSTLVTDNSVIGDLVFVLRAPLAFAV